MGKRLIYGRCGATKSYIMTWIGRALVGGLGITLYLSNLPGKNLAGFSTSSNQEVYSKGRNKDHAEVRKRFDQTNEKLQQEKLRTILKEVEISSEAIELALESMSD